jgi:hypothetical protein
MHHEQVHSQQWANYGLGFESAFLGDYTAAYSNALQAYLNPWSIYSKNPECNLVFEGQANRRDGGYVSTNPVPCAAQLTGRVY